MVSRKLEQEYMERKQRVTKFFESRKLKGVVAPIDEYEYIRQNFQNYIHTRILELY